MVKLVKKFLKPRKITDGNFLARTEENDSRNSLNIMVEYSAGSSTNRTQPFTGYNGKTAEPSTS